MKFVKACCIILIYVFNLPSGSSQPCLGFHKTSRCAISGSSDFKQYGQSRSALIEVGQLYTYSVVLYGKIDYIFTVCSESGVKPIHFKINDKTNNTVIFDNADDDYNQTIGFSIDKTIKVDIEVEILKEKEDEDPIKNRVCLGIQILTRRIPKTGFK